MESYIKFIYFFFLESHQFLLNGVNVLKHDANDIY